MEHNSQIGNKRKRFFAWDDKERCWQKANIVIGRHPDRWRLDALGKPVFKFLKGCDGPLCYGYDHFVPFSKGGNSTLSNCLIMNTKVNYLKSNKTLLPFTELFKANSSLDLTENQMDTLELAAYGNIVKMDVFDYKSSTLYQKRIPFHQKV